MINTQKLRKNRTFPKFNVLGQLSKYGVNGFEVQIIDIGEPYRMWWSKTGKRLTKTQQEGVEGSAYYDVTAFVNGRTFIINCPAEGVSTIVDEVDAHDLSDDQVSSAWFWLTAEKVGKYNQYDFRLIDKEAEKQLPRSSKGYPSKGLISSGVDEDNDNELDDDELFE